MNPINGNFNRNRQATPMQPQQIMVDINDQIPEACSCGCVYFVPAIMIYKVSALLSPTGKELLAQRPVLLCQHCNTVYEQQSQPEG